jgi:hypothetical protein
MNLCLFRLGTSRRPKPSASFSSKACRSTLVIAGSELVEQKLYGRTLSPAYKHISAIWSRKGRTACTRRPDDSPDGRILQCFWLMRSYGMKLDGLYKLSRSRGERVKIKVVGCAWVVIESRRDSFHAFNSTEILLVQFLKRKMKFKYIRKFPATKRTWRISTWHFEFQHSNLT